MSRAKAVLFAIALWCGVSSAAAEDDAPPLSAEQKELLTKCLDWQKQQTASPEAKPLEKNRLEWLEYLQKKVKP